MNRYLNPIVVTITRAQRVRTRMIARWTAAAVCVGSAAATAGMTIYALYATGLLGWAIIAGCTAAGISVRWKR